MRAVRPVILLALAVGFSSSAVQVEAQCLAPAACLPPAAARYTSTTHAFYDVPGVGTFELYNAALDQFSSCYPLPKKGKTTSQALSVRLSVQVSGPYGDVPVQTSAFMLAAVTGAGRSSGLRIFNGEIVQLSNSTGQYLIRESPTLRSAGVSTIGRERPGYAIDSFYDVFTELSVDGGHVWAPALDASQQPLAWHLPITACGGTGAPVVPDLTWDDPE